MKQLVQKVSLIVVSAVIYLVGQYFRGVWVRTIGCHEIHSGSQVYCDSGFVDTLGWPLIEIGTILFLISLVVLISNAKGFKLWKKFSLVAIPVAIGLFVLVHISFPYGSFLFIDPLRIIDFIGYWLYLPLSVLVILYSYLPLQRK